MKAIVRKRSIVKLFTKFNQRSSNIHLSGKVTIKLWLQKTTWFQNQKKKITKYLSVYKLG